MKIGIVTLIIAISYLAGKKFGIGVGSVTYSVLLILYKKNKLLNVFFYVFKKRQYKNRT
ncbi:MAG: hypothetical protein OSJ60_10340 [Lachnospiraceae bacterium]|nr:hypothetical protein [Lachnospiraceae bacterium]